MNTTSQIILSLIAVVLAAASMLLASSP